ncbi:hypothetical protein [Streptomyces sp. NPDC096339]|uniref:hypothetical protein n=1 Tax=Streptomyces sp. NPDC096339 TaxID=3366086 RepID=UPI00382715E6
MIGAGLEIAALGMGHRRIAAMLGLAESSVRGWLRAFTGRAEDERRTSAGISPSFWSHSP